MDIHRRWLLQLVSQVPLCSLHFRHKVAQPANARTQGTGALRFEKHITRSKFRPVSGTLLMLQNNAAHQNR